MQWWLWRLWWLCWPGWKWAPQALWRGGGERRGRQPWPRPPERRWSPSKEGLNHVHRLKSYSCLLWVLRCTWNCYLLSSAYLLHCAVSMKKICNSNGSKRRRRDQCNWSTSNSCLEVCDIMAELLSKFNGTSLWRYVNDVIFDDHFYKIGHPLRQKAF